MKIRPANTEDIPWILGELKKFSAFFGSKIPLFGKEDYVRGQVVQLIESHVFLVAEDEFELFGFIAGTLIPHPFNPDIKLLSELLWWVAESRRVSRVGAMLLDAFLEIGKERADWITLSLEAKSDLSDKHLVKRGFRLQERSYLLEVR